MRFLQHFMIKGMAETLEESGKALINYRVEQTACTISLQDVVMPMLDYIDNKLGWVIAQTEKLEKTRQYCDNKAEQIINEPVAFDVPVGYEITDKQFCRNTQNEYIQKAGGMDKFREKLRLLFLNRYHSFSVFSQAPMNKIIEIFYGFCASMYEHDVRSRDVLDELFRTIDDEKIIGEMFSKAIRQCDGRVATEGEANEYVPRIKVASVPSERHVERIRKLLESHDPNPGKWQVVVNPDDIDTFSMIQVRGKLNLTQFINHTDLAADTPENWKKLIDAAVDPVTAIMAGPNPNDRQLKRIIAKAIVSGLLENSEKGLGLKSFTEKIIALGDTSSAAQTLRNKYRDIVFIESSFARNLVVNEDKVMAGLKKLLSDIATAALSNPALSLIDKTAIEECIKQAELLLPRLRRMRKAAI